MTLFDETGILKISFDTNVTIHKPEDINSTNLHLEVIPNERFSLNASKFLLTYKCIEFFPDHFTLEVNFSEPEFISSYGVDKLSI